MADRAISPEEATSDIIHDHLAEAYGYDVDADTAAWLKHELVLGLVRSEDRVLDVGCANGIHLRLVAPQCRELVGVDINDRMLSLARSVVENDALTNVTLLKRSASALGMPPATFDVVYCFSTLLLVPDVEQAISEIARALREGGLAVLDVQGRFNVSQVAWRRWYRRQGHPFLHAFTRRGIDTVLRRHGLRLVTMHATGFTDQWRYVPVLRKARWISRFFHERPDLDRDYRISNRRMLAALANRWYVVARKDPF